MKILDTDLLIGFVRGSKDAIAAVAAAGEEAATTTINAAELYDGAAGSTRPVEGLRLAEHVLALLPVLPFGPRAARAYGELAGARRRAGLGGGPMDLLIASVAAAEGATVVTRNVKDFQGHKGVKVEPW